MDFPRTLLTLGLAWACAIAGCEAPTEVSIVLEINANDTALVRAHTVTDPQSVQLVAGVGVPGSVQLDKVVFHQNGEAHTEMTERTTGSIHHQFYSFDWPIVEADNGQHAWTATAHYRDSGGAATLTSNPVTVTVNIDGTTDPGPLPGGCARVDSVASGGRFTCAVTRDGELWCWGWNEHGVLGQGDTVQHLDPVQVGTDSDWANVSAGLSHVCAVREDDSLWCWGDAGSQQLGTGNNTDQYAPVRIGTDTDWSSVSLGAFHSCAFKNDSTLWCWGYNWYGQTGIVPRQVTVLAPNEVSAGGAWQDHAGGMSTSCATRTDGTLWCSGVNGTGQLGLGDRETRHALTRVGTQTGWGPVETAQFHSCSIRNGELWCWGANNGWVFGQGLDGLAADHQQLTPLKLNDDSWSDVSAGELQTCAIQTNGTLWCWGWNGDGGLGHGDRISKYVPVQVGTDTDWTTVEVTQQLHTFGGFRNHVCGLRENGALYCWGANHEGQLGQGDTESRYSPTSVCIE